MSRKIVRDTRTHLLEILLELFDFFSRCASRCLSVSGWILGFLIGVGFLIGDLCFLPDRVAIETANDRLIALV